MINEPENTDEKTEDASDDSSTGNAVVDEAVAIDAAENAAEVEGGLTADALEATDGANDKTASPLPDESAVTTDEVPPTPALIQTTDGAVADRRTNRSWTAAPRRTVLGLIGVFAIIELSGVVFDIPVQVALTALAAFVCVNMAIFGYRTNRTAGVVMAAVFTTRLVALTIPATDISLPTRVGLVAVAAIAVSYIATWVLSVDISSGRMEEGFPLKPAWVSGRVTAMITMLAGFPIGAAVYGVVQPDQLRVLPLFNTTVAAWAVVMLLLAIAALGEELLFRRLVAAMVQHTGRSQAPWPSAALYAAAFIGTQDPLMIGLAFVSGALWSWCCERTGTIEPVAVSHIIATIIAFVALPAMIG